MFGHSTHRETDAQPIKVGDVPFNFQTAPVVPTKFAKRLPTDGDVWIILEWSFRQVPGNLCFFDETTDMDELKHHDSWQSHR